MTQHSPKGGSHNKTLFVAPQAAGPAAAPQAAAPKVTRGVVGRTSDVTRVRPMYVAAIAGAGGLLAAFAASDAADDKYGGGPGPLTPAHVKAKLSCEKCHGNAEQGTDKFVSKAKGSCVDGCHGPHPSTRDGHRRLAKEGTLGCTTCHTIHGPQSGVKLSEDGPAARYSVWGVKQVPEVSFHAGRNVLVPTIPVKVCRKCHSDKADDPLARCRSYAGGGELEPTVCFDEHRVALPATPVASSDKNRPLLGSRKKPPAPPGPKKNEGVCSEQHFEDRSFAWEAARDVVARVPVLEKGQAGGSKTSLGWFGAAAGLAGLGYVATAAAELVVRRRRAKKAETKGSVAPAPAEKKKLPIIDTNTCLGCYACVDACPYGVLEVERYVAVVARPDACCGLVLCEQRCPNGSLMVADEGTVLDRPRVSPSLESMDVPGLFLSGDVTGLPLIKNAILQGAKAAEAAHKSLPSRPKAAGRAHDVCIIGAGPAGISAALRLSELGVDSIVLEQGGVAQSIQNFPRGKLVFDQPLELPMEGKLWLKESSKEELLLHWMRIVRQKGLKIRENTRMSSIDRQPDGLFLVRAVEEESEPREVLARSIILAIGQRGSPRRLAVPVPPEAEGHIHYHLADARSLAGGRIVVVGLGDSAMEAAIALAHQPKTSVTILARADTYARGQPRNIAEVERLRKAKRLEMRFGVEVAEVHPGWLVAKGIKDSQRVQISFDSLLVMIGTIPPWDLLRRVGISPPARLPAPEPLVNLVQPRT